MNNIKKYAKKNKYKIITFLTIFAVLIPALFFYSFYKVVEFVNQRDYNIYKDGYEVGRFEQLNEDADNTQKQIQANLLDHQTKILTTLAHIESYNGKIRKLLDTNNKYSLGLYHFQADTVKDMYKRYYGQVISTNTAVSIAEDDDLSTKLATDAIFKYKELYHWHWSMVKMNRLGLIAYNY